jgi:hypothetical protein
MLFYSTKKIASLKFGFSSINSSSEVSPIRFSNCYFSSKFSFATTSEAKSNFFFIKTDCCTFVSADLITIESFEALNT